MMYYSEENYSEINRDNRSLIVAFANLLKHFNMDTEPSQLAIELTEDDPKVDWWSLPEHIDGIENMQVIDQPGSWPTTSHAIVKYRRIDPEAGGPVAHYCLVADFKAATIVDSLDGQIKPAGTYGTILAWASYINELEVVASSEPVDPKSIYIVPEPGESAWEIVRKLGIHGLIATDLIDHNDIETPVLIPAGTLLHLPIIKTQAKEEKLVEYEFLEDPLLMHVTKEDGASKFSFGNVKKWKDIKPTGPTYPVNTNLKIVAIAYVPIEGEKDEAAFYMDNVSVGNHAVTGRVAYTTGFNHSHLADGHVEKVKPAQRADIKAKLKEAEAAKAEAIAAELQTLEPEPQIPEWKLTKRPISHTKEHYTYIALNDIMVREMDGRKPARLLEKDKGVKLAYLFEKDGVTYGLPTSHSSNNYWYGIPMDQLTIKSDGVYTVEVGNSQNKNAILSLEERVVVVLSKVLSQYTRFSAKLWQRNKK